MYVGYIPGSGRLSEAPFINMIYLNPSMEKKSHAQ